ncbi:hypothetical protein AAP_03126 [Ascosphaera apis ARSEF 7405]|uniref:Nineteen complex-related protein 2-domain-containing protein n=1 Tax=Ascosphaera apis ARSEF 7405 TaxID=392613 RepID=A0A167YY53_9EURO|nr:hypothetical protein AAP_03126 [Ascosphaera apis ARSEF 7405]
MSSLFAKRRGPRKISTNEEDDENEPDTPVVIKQAARKQKTKSRVRQAYRVGQDLDEDGDEEEGSAVVRPTKLGLNARALEHSALAAAPTSSVAQDGVRPSYTKEDLQNLKQLTPSLPHDPSNTAAADKDDQTVAQQDKQVDVAAKFGEIVQVTQPSNIPTEAEIREKKERRARLAKEYAAEDFISLEDDVASDEDWAIAGKKDANENTRLVRDDEDFAEGFDEFVEDGQIALGARAERARKQKQREEMRELIEAEESSDDEDTDAENRAAYEEAQTRAAMYGQSREATVPARPSTPPKVVPLPRLSDSIMRLQTSLGVLEATKTRMLLRMDELRKEKIEIANREAEIQRLLKETGDRYEKLKAETGAAPTSNNLIMDAPGGLENLGTLKAADAASSSSSDVEMTED